MPNTPNTSNDPYDTMLYPFQRKGVDYLVENGGGFLFDEPGLGKTRQAIIAAHRLGGPVLVICPNSLKRWWRTELKMIYPNASIAMAGRGGRFGKYNNSSLPKPSGPKGQELMPRWWIVHYTGVRMNEELHRLPWSVIILDECHYIKNRKAKRTKAIMELSHKYVYRIGLSATPYGTNPADLWSQLRWMAPTLPGLRSYWRFYNTFVDFKYEVHGKQQYRKVTGGRNLKLLARVMAAYGIRRDKKIVAPQLPPITDTSIPLVMNGVQKAFYKQLRNKANIELTIPGDAVGPEVELHIINALSRLLRMEQWLSHPWTWKSDIKGAKLEWLLEWVQGYSKQAVIATRFKATAKYIAELLKRQQAVFDGGGGEARPRCRSPITGDISVNARQGIIDAWKAGEQQFIVGTIDTIGIGLSFEQAHSMVMFDVLWSPIKMEQARQRIHRITSDHPVEVLYPYVEGTTNELVLGSFVHKWRQIELVRKFIQYLQESATPPPIVTNYGQ